jgi:hypothetical protein
MSNYLVNVKCDPDDGLDYIFVKMGAIYGAAFLRNWEGLDMAMVRQVWSQEIGHHLTDKKILDHALKNLPADRPPNAIAFRNLCSSSPDILDLRTLHGVNTLAVRIGESQWSQMESFITFQEKIFAKAKKLGVLNGSQH